MTLERRYKLHQAMRNATLGLFGAVMSLFCLHKGLTLYQVGLFFGIYYLAVICMDLPGGIIADRLGRFKLFRFAKLFDCLYFALLIFSDQVFMLFVASLLGGIGRSLSNGVMESWYYEQLKAQGRLDAITKHLSSAQAWATLGGAIGALVGTSSVQWLGYWLTPNNPFLPVLLLALVFHFTLMLTLDWFYPEGEKRREVTQSQRSGLVVMRQTFARCWANSVLKGVLLLQLMHGMLVVSLISFWQPVFKGFLASSTNVIALGLVSGAFFLASALASKLLARLLSHINYDLDWLVLPFFGMASLMMILLSFAESAGLFVCFYVLFGCCIMAVTPLTSSIMHHQTIDKYRATYMSVLTLTFNGGGLLVGVLLSQIAELYSIGRLWLTLGVLGLLVTLVLKARLNLRH